MGMIKKLFKKTDKENEIIQEPEDMFSEEQKSLFDGMMDHFARIDFNPNFVLKIESLDGTEYSPKCIFKEKLREQPYYLGTYSNICRSFMLVKMMARNAAQCEEQTIELWKQLYPENANAIRVLAYPDDGTETAEVLKEVYNGYIGWDSYCRLVTDMAYEAEFIKNKATRKAVMAQNFLVSIDSGCGFTTMVSSFSDFLTRAGYFTDSANCYHECIINEDEDAGDVTPKEFFNFLKGNGDEKDENLKEQCVGLDISYYLDESKYDALRKFIKRLHSFQSKFVFLFRIPYLEEKSRRKIYDLIEDIVNVKEIVIEPYSELIYEEEFIDFIEKYGFHCSQGVIELFKERMQIERRDGRFYGFRTINKLADETVLLKMKHIAECKRGGRKLDLLLIDTDEASELATDYTVTGKSGYEELHSLIGMEEIEAKIREIVAQVKLAKSSEKLEMPCLHMRFTGAPGTGKTTVARILGKIFKEEGILRKGNFFEYSARSLCGQYVGQTAPKTAQICRDAYGSVLFLDEAYALYTGKGELNNADYGREAVATLIAEMENHRDDMVVIMAGYTDDMARLMEINSGLRSRMPFVIEFKSYTKEQLAAIFMNCVRKNFEQGEGLEAAVKSYFSELSDDYIASKEFANARYVRNLYERTWAKTAQRIGSCGESHITITVDDFKAACAEKEFSEELVTNKAIGFK